MDAIEIYTDGSEKDGWGAWSYLFLRYGQVVAEASGRVRSTNSNRMEFQAAIEALKALDRHEVFAVTLHTDCRILIENIPKLESWEENGWLRRKIAIPIPNADLYQELHALNQKNQITWKWVRAHSGNPHNDRCDELCRLAREPSEQEK